MKTLVVVFRKERPAKSIGNRPEMTLKDATAEAALRQNLSSLAGKRLPVNGCIV